MDRRISYSYSLRLSREVVIGAMGGCLIVIILCMWLLRGILSLLRVGIYVSVSISLAAIKVSGLEIHGRGPVWNRNNESLEEEPCMLPVSLN